MFSVRWSLPAGFATLVLLLAAGLVACDGDARVTRPIRVAILHSLTGTMAVSEKSVVDAELMAIDEINAKGGILGRRIQPVIADGRSDWPTFAREAERLITKDRVDAIFGCWTSACRKTTVPVIERLNHLLFYPIQYEGLEQSPNVVYTGATPNQQILPAAKWFLDNRGKTFFLVGSDYVFPRSANAIIRDQLDYLGGKVVGEEYIPLGSKDVSAIVFKIKAAKPAVILNTINGDSNIPFFEKLSEAGIDPRKTPTVSFSIAEDELRGLGAKSMTGNYAVWNYFQSIDSPANSRFVHNFKTRLGVKRVTDDPIESGYVAVNLWARAVQAAGTSEPDAVRETIRGQSFGAPQGDLWVDRENQHLWKKVRIGRIQPDGQFKIVWVSEVVIHPVPYPPSRPREVWEELLNDLYEKWDHTWARPVKEP